MLISIWSIPSWIHLWLQNPEFYVAHFFTSTSILHKSCLPNYKILRVLWHLLSNVHIHSIQKTAFHQLYTTCLVLLYIRLLNPPSKFIRIHILHHIKTSSLHHVYVGQTLKIPNDGLGSIRKIHSCIALQHTDRSNWGPRMSSPPQLTPLAHPWGLHSPYQKILFIQKNPHSLTPSHWNCWENLKTYEMDRHTHMRSFKVSRTRDRHSFGRWLHRHLPVT